MTEAVRNRVVDIDTGVVMVVTDLHGDGELYTRYRDVFLQLRAQGLAQTLVFTGDLIHSEGAPEADQSLDIILDLITLQAELGPNLVVLLGNHEMPHIYHVPLSKGDHIYTPRFEAALGDDRAKVLAYFRSLPFFIRTPAGVTICHAGAFPEAQDPEVMAKLRSFSHEAVLAAAAAEMPPDQRPALRRAVSELSDVPYVELARTYTAVADERDPRYDDYLLGIFAGYQEDFRMLWSALFSRNEHDQGMAAYHRQVLALLADLSESYAPQSVLVTGHIGCRNGYRVIAEGSHLRIASGVHAHPYRSARYLLFNAKRPVASADDLLPGLGSVFRA